MLITLVFATIIDGDTMQKNKLVSPVVKWVGGKRQLLGEIIPLIPKSFSSYAEPFLGGGAVLFALQPNKAIINDLNSDLITMYKVIKEHPDELIADLGTHINSQPYFYSLRDIDRDKEAYSLLSDVKKASRLIYLNKTCYNGLFRVNSAGEFNTPFGHYKNPNIVNEPVIRAVSNYFNKAQITFFSQDFAKVLDTLKKGCFVYLDPPYDPVSDTASFTGYNKGGFDRDEQLRLKECCDFLTKRNIKFMLSNSATEYIKDIYCDYNITFVKATRAVNSDGAKRGAVDEVIIRNYDTE